ncbi:MAG: tRNA uridine-5-carboxymethylaminomethyl(34) synthesis GTPase MnmE [Arenimonas sp.]
MNKYVDTIVAIATAKAPAGIGILRLSGPKALAIAEAMLRKKIVARQASYGRFLDENDAAIDDGIAVYFSGPHSYTGEDVVELQAHGNPYLLAQLLRRCITLGARQARPGEFTERAFLNEKLDLAQAEAVADLISAGSEAAARAARRSLDGDFSKRVHEVEEGLVNLRVYIEAALDFPEEEIDFLAAPQLQSRLKKVQQDLNTLLQEAERGKRLLDGVHVVIVGAPNVGKSSLLNRLAGEERAIVTDIAGTTRDVLRESITLDGVVITLVDTAGLRDTADVVEQEGIKRAHRELVDADLALAVLDDREAESSIQQLRASLAGVPRILWLHNKCDLSGKSVHEEQREDGKHLWLSARAGDGFDGLRQALREVAGLNDSDAGSFSARERHVEALFRAKAALALAAEQLDHKQGELAAHELRDSHHALGEITGQMDADALLGRIFSSFCIGK